MREECAKWQPPSHRALQQIQQLGGHGQQEEGLCVDCENAEQCRDDLVRRPSLRKPSHVCEQNSGHRFMTYILWDRIKC